MNDDSLNPREVPWYFCQTHHRIEPSYRIWSRDSYCDPGHQVEYPGEKGFTQTDETIAALQRLISQLVTQIENTGQITSPNQVSTHQYQRQSLSKGFLGIDDAHHL